MKVVTTSIFAVAVLIGSSLTPQIAHAQSTLVLSCEQGAPGSWKFCEVIPDTYPTYVWSVSGGGVLDPYVCTTNSSACTAYCHAGSHSGYLHVSIYNSSNQLVATKSKSLGCIS